MASPLPAPRLVITSHDAKGKSIFSSDTVIPAFYPFGPAATGFTTFHTAASVLAVNFFNMTPVPNVGFPRCPPSGAIFCINDFPPNYIAPMHRTISIDYAVVLSGEICLKLERGDKTMIRAGEMLIQGGANHQWNNKGPGYCRMLCVMLAAEIVKFKDGTVLEETVIGRPPPQNK